MEETPKDLTTIIAEDHTIKRIVSGVTTTYKEIKALQDELNTIKNAISLSMASQEERLEIRKLELDKEKEIRQLELDKAREQESHQWERSLPLSSETTSEIVKALNIVKSAGIEINKTGLNGRNGKSEDNFGISLDDLLNTFEMPLAKVGIDINHSIIAGFNAKDDDILKTMLRHSSGEYLAAYSKIRTSFTNAGTDLQQKRSAALSYAKRHNVQCLLGQ